MRRNLVLWIAAAVVLATLGLVVMEDERPAGSGGCVEVHEGDSPETVTVAMGTDPVSTTTEPGGTELYTWPGGWVRFRDGQATGWHSLVYGTPKICDPPPA